MTMNKCHRLQLIQVIDHRLNLLKHLAPEGDEVVTDIIDTYHYFKEHGCSDLELVTLYEDIQRNLN